MQQATPLHTPRRFGGSFAIRGALALLMALVALAGMWLSVPRASVPAPGAPSLTLARPRAFTDEAAYVPSAAEYANLVPGDTYLPPPSAPRATATNRPPRTRIFADEAAYVPNAAEYAAFASIAASYGAASSTCSKLPSSNTSCLGYK